MALSILGIDRLFSQTCQRFQALNRRKLSSAVTLSLRIMAQLKELTMTTVPATTPLTKMCSSTLMASKWITEATTASSQVTLLSLSPIEALALAWRVSRLATETSSRITPVRWWATHQTMLLAKLGQFLNATLPRTTCTIIHI